MHIINYSPLFKNSANHTNFDFENFNKLTKINEFNESNKENLENPENTKNTNISIEKTLQYLQYLPYPVSNPFLEHLGAKLLSCDIEGEGCLLYLPFQNHFANSWGKVHGGVLMTMMDMSMSWAARAQHLENMGAATIEMKSTFMQAATGDLLIAGSVSHKTATLAFCQAYVYNLRGEICCHSTSTFKYSKRLVASTNP